MIEDGRDSREGGYDISRSDPSAFKLQRLDSCRGNYPQRSQHQEVLFVFGFIFREVTGDISVEKKMILCSLLVLKAIHAKQKLP